MEVVAASSMEKEMEEEEKEMEEEEKIGDSGVLVNVISTSFLTFITVYSVYSPSNSNEFVLNY